MSNLSASVNVDYKFRTYLQTVASNLKCLVKKNSLFDLNSLNHKLVTRPIADMREHFNSKMFSAFSFSFYSV